MQSSAKNRFIKPVKKEIMKPPLYSLTYPAFRSRSAPGPRTPTPSMTIKPLISDSSPIPSRSIATAKSTATSPVNPTLLSPQAIHTVRGG